jgi:LemA protein
MKDFKFKLIIAVVVIAVIIMSVFMVQSSQNKAIGLEEAVYTAESDIKVQEKRRVDLVYNLADCVMQYDKHESDTLTNIADNMSNGNTVDDVNTAISAITYNYPELQSNENYKNLMNELSITENLIAQYRENYNKSVTAYNRFIKKFPSRIFLDWTGYEIINFERLDYNAPVDAPQNLFGE